MVTRRRIGTARQVNQGGRPPALEPQQVSFLHGVVAEMPHATLEDWQPN